MEQNNPTFRFEVFVKKPTIERAMPCIADLLTEQKVLSGVQKVVIPFTINNYRGKLPVVTITPNDAVAKPIPLTQAVQVAGGARNQPFEIHVEGLTASGGPKTYTVKISGADGEDLKMCDANEEPLSTITVFPSELLSKADMDRALDNKVTIGKSLKLAIKPSAGGEIPANQYELSYTINGQTEKIQGSTPLEIRSKCIGKDVSSVNVQVKWHYDPPGSQYEEYVVLYDKSISKPQIKTGAPTINVNEVIVGSFETKTLKMSVSGIQILPPKIDCDVVAPEKDLKIEVIPEPLVLGKYNVIANIEPDGPQRYKVTVQLKGPRLKFQGDNLKLTIKAGMAGLSKPPTEEITVSIPDFK
jgi:hypothetical protein